MIVLKNNLNTGTVAMIFQQSTGQYKLAVMSFKCQY